MRVGGVCTVRVVSPVTGPSAFVVLARMMVVPVVSAVARPDGEIVATALGEFSFFYQPAADGEPSVVQRRHGGGSRVAGSSPAADRAASCCER